MPLLTLFTWNFHLGCYISTLGSYLIIVMDWLGAHEIILEMKGKLL